MIQLNKQQKALLDQIIAGWADKGQVVEGGWQAFVALQAMQGRDRKDLRELRKVWFLSAQHLYAAILGFLDPTTPDEEPTAQDLSRMAKLHEELEAFERQQGH